DSRRGSAHAAPGADLGDGVQLIVSREDLRHGVVQSTPRHKIHHAIPGDKSFRIMTDTYVRFVDHARTEYVGPTEGHPVFRVQIVGVNSPSRKIVVTPT